MSKILLPQGVRTGRIVVPDSLQRRHRPITLKMRPQSPCPACCGVGYHPEYVSFFPRRAWVKIACPVCGGGGRIA